MVGLHSTQRSRRLLAAQTGNSERSYTEAVRKCNGISSLDQSRTANLSSQSLPSSPSLRHGSCGCMRWFAEKLHMGHRVNNSRVASKVERIGDERVKEIKNRVLKCTDWPSRPHSPINPPMVAPVTILLLLKFVIHAGALYGKLQKRIQARRKKRVTQPPATRLTIKTRRAIHPQMTRFSAEVLRGTGINN